MHRTRLERLRDENRELAQTELPEAAPLLDPVSVPTPVANTIGKMATIATPSVSSFGRSLWTAPSITTVTGRQYRRRAQTMAVNLRNYL